MLTSQSFFVNCLFVNMDILMCILPFSREFARLGADFSWISNRFDFCLGCLWPIHFLMSKFFCETWTMVKLKNKNTNLTHYHLKCGSFYGSHVFLLTTVNFYSNLKYKKPSDFETAFPFLSRCSAIKGNSNGFVSGLIFSLSVIISWELGDPTFIFAVIREMKNPCLAIFLLLWVKWMFRKYFR